MGYRIVLARPFKRSVKKLTKRYPRVKEDVRTAVEVLLQTPNLGAVIPGGSGVRKLRVRNTDLQKGKSAGYRLLYFVVDGPTGIIYLLLLYAKSDRSDITHRELKDLLTELIDE